MSGDVLLSMPELSGIHFTGSTQTFRGIYKKVGENVANYRSYPRLVGETGGKDFFFVHPSADPKVVVANLLRGAFEYQGQKCSAASRAYIPESVWARMSEDFLSEVASIKVGDPEDFRNFMNAVIDERAFNKHVSYIEYARKSPDAKIIQGGTYSKTEGYFIQPTVILTTDPMFKSMQEEIFGPVATIYVYPDAKLAETLSLAERTGPYALTGAIIAEDRKALDEMALRLRHAAGNLYLNDKCTGAVVGQQPFGGARASGTNDKAGSMWNLIRWISPRTIKEVNPPVKDYRYPFLGEA
jgi:1-pyrroline-5-carboxylate dehydrogenase